MSIGFKFYIGPSLGIIVGVWGTVLELQAHNRDAAIWAALGLVWIVTYTFHMRQVLKSLAS